MNINILIYFYIFFIFQNKIEDTNVRYSIEIMLYKIMHLFHFQSFIVLYLLQIDIYLNCMTSYIRK
jgi:hypothetical protein